jgi:hypothetical protein
VILTAVGGGGARGAGLGVGVAVPVVGTGLAVAVGTGLAVAAEADVGAGGSVAPAVAVGASAVVVDPGAWAAGWHDARRTTAMAARAVRWCHMVPLLPATVVTASLRRGDELDGVL